MGNACKPQDEAAKIDKEINEMLRKDKKKYDEEIKLLLLGASLIAPFGFLYLVLHRTQHCRVEHIGTEGERTFLAKRLA